MRVLLVNPSLDEKERKNPLVGSLFYNAMPLGICYLASSLLKEKIDVKLLDAAAEWKPHREVVKFLKENNIDVVGITSTSSSFYRALGLAEEIKKVAGSSIPIILGGPHITAIPHHAMSFSAFDYGVIGEGELTLVDLLRTLDRGGDLIQVKGIAFRQNGDLVLTPKRELIMDLDLIPFPARHLLKRLDVYSSLLTDVRYIPKYTILANRGCPFNCIFCDSAAFGKRYRAPSPKYMADEVELLVKDFGAKEIAFVGTTFTVNRERTQEFCDILIDRGIKVAWTVSTRADVLDKELLIKMMKAGCWDIRLGIESGNEEVLKFIGKRVSTEQVRNVAKWCEEIGMHSKGFFILGHLIETKESIEDTINFALSIPLTDMTVQLNTPLPNTPQYDLAPKYGTFRAQDFSRFDFFTPVFVPHGMTEEYLVAKQREFYRRFYLRWKTIKKHLDKINPVTVLNYLKALKLFLYLTIISKTR